MPFIDHPKHSIRPEADQNMLPDRQAKYGKRPDWRKAVVKLSEGSIEIL